MDSSNGSSPPTSSPDASTVEAFPPELHLLLTLVRSALERRAPPVAPATPLRWPVFVALAERHRLASFLHHRAADAVAATCPPEVRQRLRELARAGTRRALHVARELARLVQQLDA